MISRRYRSRHRRSIKCRKKQIVSSFIRLYGPIILSFISVCISMFSLYKAIIIDNKENFKVITADCSFDMTYRKDISFERDMIITISNNSDREVSIVYAVIEVNGDSQYYYPDSDNELGIPFNIPANTTTAIHTTYNHFICDEDRLILQDKLDNESVFQANYIRGSLDDIDDNIHRPYCEDSVEVKIGLISSKGTKVYYEFWKA